ncbi:MAG: sirohydrochlorin chelatase [Thiobacillaceae bacterium]
MSTTHLLIIAHGSRREASNDEVRRLAGRVRELCAPGLDHVEVAFLELAEPSIPEGLARCVAQGAREIVVFPYFLAAGTHVALDIPEAISAFAHKHPDIRIRLTPHLGASDALPHAILSVALAGQASAHQVAVNRATPHDRSVRT